jgi:SprT protein
MPLIKLPSLSPTPLPKPSEQTVKKMRGVLEQKVPDKALEYCLRLWEENPFSFTVARTRSSCFGNYIFRNNTHKITVNHDLNPYAFLLTYIHEVAHLHTQLLKFANRRKKILPHGIEWKKNFQNLMLPVLNTAIYPEKILTPLSKYMSDPAASSVGYAPLQEALRAFDEKQEDDIALNQVPNNQWFEFRGAIFRRLELRRTRVLCIEKKTSRKYTISAVARVKLIDD